MAKDTSPDDAQLDVFAPEYNQLPQTDQASTDTPGQPATNPLFAEYQMDKGAPNGAVIPAAGAEVIVDGRRVTPSGDGNIVIQYANNVVINYGRGDVDPRVVRVEQNAGAILDNYPEYANGSIRGDRPYYQDGPQFDNDGRIFSELRRRGPGNQVYVQSDGPVGVSQTVRQGPNTVFRNTSVGTPPFVPGNDGGWTSDHTVVLADTLLNGWAMIEGARGRGGNHGGSHYGGGRNGGRNFGIHIGVGSNNDGGWNGNYGGQWQQRGPQYSDIAYSGDGDFNQTVRQGPNTRFETTRIGTPPFVPGNDGGWSSDHTVVLADTLLNGWAMIEGARNRGGNHGGGHHNSGFRGGDMNYHAQRRNQQVAQSRANFQVRYNQARNRNC